MCGTGIATTNKVNWLKLCFSDIPYIPVSFYVWPVARKNLIALGVNLDLPHAVHTREKKAQVEPPYPREQ